MPNKDNEQHPKTIFIEGCDMYAPTVPVTSNYKQSIFDLDDYDRGPETNEKRRQVCKRALVVFKVLPFIISLVLYFLWKMIISFISARVYNFSYKNNIKKNFSSIKFSYKKHGLVAEIFSQVIFLIAVLLSFLLSEVDPMDVYEK